MEQTDIFPLETGLGFPVTIHSLSREELVKNICIISAPSHFDIVVSTHFETESETINLNKQKEFTLKKKR